MQPAYGPDKVPRTTVSRISGGDGFQVPSLFGSLVFVYLSPLNLDLMASSSNLDSLLSTSARDLAKEQEVSVPSTGVSSFC